MIVPSVNFDEFNKLNENTIGISVQIPKAYNVAMLGLIKRGRYPNRSAAVRVAIRDFLMTEAKFEEEFLDPIKEEMNEIMETDDTLIIIPINNADGSFSGDYARYKRSGIA